MECTNHEKAKICKCTKTGTGEREENEGESNGREKKAGMDVEERRSA